MVKRRMSQAEESFVSSILDAENLLCHFDTLNTRPPPPEIEVLKRAGLVMAMTAWETYVEDRIVEACDARVQALSDESIADFVRQRCDDEIKRLNNPDSEKTLKLFKDYAGVDLAEHWRWNQCDPASVRSKLNGYIKLRGEVVHRSSPISPDAPKPHPVRKVDLAKAIAFLKNLVAATERAFPEA